MFVLRGAFATAHARLSERCVLGFTRCDSFAPEPKASGFKFSTHQVDDTALGKPEDGFDGFKRSSVLPGHFDDSRCIVDVIHCLTLS